MASTDSRINTAAVDSLKDHNRSTLEKSIVTVTEAINHEAVRTLYMNVHSNITELAPESTPSEHDLVIDIQDRLREALRKLFSECKTISMELSLRSEEDLNAMLPDIEGFCLPCVVRVVSSADVQKTQADAFEF
jgi:hypothetical protein